MGAVQQLWYRAVHMVPVYMVDYKILEVLFLFIFNVLVFGAEWLLFLVM